MHPLAGVIENADEPPAFAFEARGDFAHRLFPRLQRLRNVQLKSRAIRRHVIDHQRIAIPERPAMQADVIPFIDVGRNSMWRNPDLRQSRNRL